MRSILATVLFRQAYHAGQTGILRRLAGKEEAIRYAISSNRAVKWRMTLGANVKR